MTIKTAVFGEALFDLIEQHDKSLQAFIGGSPFNVARSFAKQGIAVDYLSPISIDEYGKRIFDYALSENISVPANNRSSLPTSLALVYKDENGQPDYRLYRKHIADLDITAKQLMALVNDELDLFHTGSLTLVPDMLSTLKPCFEQLKAKGIIISVDINMRKGVEADNDAYVNAVLALLPYADIVKVSDEDLSLLGITAAPLEGAKQILAKLTNGMVLLTQGEHGATLLSNNVEIQRPVFTPTEFVDAVGAGDTFFSAFLANLLSHSANKGAFTHSELEQALVFGLMAATLNVEKNGCQPPTAQDVIEALAQRNN
ncbi:MAG: PfkB family carbohydrate kinase [Glaciecola sp.]